MPPDGVAKARTAALGTPYIQSRSFASRIGHRFSLRRSRSSQKRTMSAAAWRLISAAQKKRWAAKGAKTAKVVVAPKPASKAAAATAPAPKKKWKLSAAGLARIKAANKAYWTAKKAAKK